MDEIELINNEVSYTFENLAGLEGFEYYKTSVIVEDLPGRIGAVHVNSSLGRRILSWQSLIKNNTTANRSAIIRACEVGDLKTIKFTGCGGIPMQAEVEILKLFMPYKIAHSIAIIEAVAPDPRFYSQTLDSVPTAITSLGGGSPIPTEVPMSMTAEGTVRPIITNAGNIATPPTFIIRGPGTNFIIHNITTGLLCRVNITLLAGEIVTIDMKNRTVIKGTNTNVYGLFIGSFFSLGVGNNEIHFSAQTGSSADTLLTIQYRNAYGGI